MFEFLRRLLNRHDAQAVRLAAPAQNHHLSPQSLLGRAKTTGYEPIRYDFFRRPRDLAPFTFETIEAMLFDPTVRLGLAMRAAPLYSIEFAYQQGDDWTPGVEARRPEVAAFVLRQLKRLWDCEIEAVLSDQTWGWSAGEITYRLTPCGTVEIDRLLPRHARDVRARVRGGELCGVRFSRIQGQAGAVDLDFPKCWWRVYQPEASLCYSAGALPGAYSPWADKWLHGGALDVRRLFMHKDAYGGADMTYPEGTTLIPDGAGGMREVPNRDIAREALEQMVAGGVTARPGGTDERGNELWKLTRATTPAAPTHILQFPQDLDGEILRGLEITDDVVSADGTGAWAGKRVPMAAFYGSLDRWATSVIRTMTVQVLEPLVWLNFGAAEPFNVDHKPLGLQAMEQQGASGQGGQQSGQAAPGQPSFSPQSPAQPQAMSLEAQVGRGYESAERIVRMARAAAGFGSRDRWITTDDGTHLRIDKDGKVTAGPAGLEGRYLRELPKRGAQAKRDRKDKADAKRRFERGESVASIAKRHSVSERSVRQVAERGQAKTAQVAEDNVRAIAAEVVGDDQADQDGFIELVKDFHKEKAQGVAEYNQQLADFLSGDKRANQSLRGTIQLIQTRGGDATGIKGFDQVLDFAERYYPALLQVPGDPGHDAESALMHNIAQGKLPTPDLDDPDIIGEAIEYAESFQRSYQAKAEEDDAEPIPFALRMASEVRRGATKIEDGKLFRFNENHRWERVYDPSQQAAGFASANLSARQSFEQALKQTESRRHQRFTQIAREIDRTLGLKSITTTVIGDWVHEAEASIVTRYVDFPDFEELEYALAWRGKIAKQEATLLFQQAPQADDRLWLFSAKESIDSTRKALDKFGLPYRSVAKSSDNETAVYIVSSESFGSDVERDARNVAKAGEHYGVVIQETEGIAKEIGVRGSRQKAIEEYDRIIREREKRFPDRERYRLSRRLSLEPPAEGRSAGRQVAYALPAPPSKQGGADA